MRIALLILLLFMQALANDTETGVLAGEVQPLKSQRLRLVREDLTIKVGEKVDVEVNFRLRNEGEACRVQLGFPYFGLDDEPFHEADDPTLYDFECQVDGQSVSVSEQKGKPLRSWYKSTSWKVWEVDFAPGQTRDVFHRYRATLSGSTGNTFPRAGTVHFFDYILTTARNWKAPIGEFHLAIIPQAPRYFKDDLYWVNLAGMKFDGTAFRIDRTNWVPDVDLFFSLCGGYVRKKREGGSLNSRFKLRLGHALAYRPLTDDDLKNKSGRELTLMRNEIYARRGRPFHDAQLAAYFKKQEWYRPDPHYSEAKLTLLEMHNALFIADYQAAHGLQW